MNHVRNLSIAKRLAFAFGFAVLMLLGQCALGIVGLYKTQSLLETTVSDMRTARTQAQEFVINPHNQLAR